MVLPTQTALRPKPLEGPRDRCDMCEIFQANVAAGLVTRLCRSMTTDLDVYMWLKSVFVSRVRPLAGSVWAGGFTALQGRYHGSDNGQR